jgi:hypothetical protein
VSSTANQHDAIAAVELALAEAARLAGSLPERLRDHLRRPYRPRQRKLAITASYTVDRTVPRKILSWQTPAEVLACA